LSASEAVTEPAVLAGVSTSHPLLDIVPNSSKFITVELQSWLRERPIILYRMQVLEDNFISVLRSECTHHTHTHTHTHTHFTVALFVK
jgi:hypothetical protein